MKRIIAVFLTIVLMLGCFSSCANVSAEEKYIIKGEFFSLIMSKMNFYPINFTWEEMENSHNYDIEAQSMLDWGLLPEEIATKGLYRYVDKETVALACLNSIYFTVSGNIDDVKDAKLCKYPQEMADAVASGIIELDNNGCVNAKEKLTFEECEQIIDKTMSVEANGHFEEGTGTFEYDFGENSACFTPDDLLDGERIIVENYDDTDDEADAGYVDCSESVLVGNLLLEDDDLRATNVEKISSVVSVPARVFKEVLGSPKVGDIIVYDAKLIKDHKVNDYNALNSESFAGRLVSFNYINNNVRCMLSRIEDEEIMAHTEAKEIGSKATNVEKELLTEEYAGFKFSIDPIEGGVKVSAKKTLEFSYDEYGDWRDATLHPTVELSASISNIEIDIDDIKYLFKKDKSNKNEEISLIKFTYDLKKSFKIDAKARFVPDSNRNATFWTNFTKSRFTDGKGAESIKIAKFNVTIPNTGIYIPIYVILNISFDGTIEITLSNSGTGFEVIKKNGNVCIRDIEGDEYQEGKMDTNLGVGLELEASLCFTLVKNIIVYGVELKFNINLAMKLYYENNNVGKSNTNCDSQKAADMLKSDEKFGYIIDGKWSVQIIGKLKPENSIKPQRKCLLYKVLGKSKAEKLSFKIQIAEETIHYEFNVTIAQDAQNNEDDKKASSEGKFLLDSTKLNIEDGTCGDLKITGMPISEKKIAKNYVSGIQVRVKDESIAEAVYLESTNSIVVSAVKPGSTEVEVYVYKDKRNGKEYMQTFSVTISENPDMEYQSFTYDFFESPLGSKVIYYA